VVKKESSGEIIGAFTLIPPQGVENSIWIYSKIGIGGFVSKFGLSALFRMLRLDAKNKQLLAKSLDNLEHYYLSMVAVKEEYRGYGVGSSMIKHVINELTASGSICNLIGLTTQLPENVIFYSRLGFDKLEEGTVIFGKSKYYNCNMRYDLQSRGCKS